MPSAVPANCLAVEDALIRESGRISEPMWARNARQRPILRLQSKTRGVWQDGIGVEPSSTIFERAFPALTGDDWEDVSYDGAVAGETNCLPPTEVVSFGQTTIPFKLRHKAVRTQRWCVESLRTGNQMSSFLENVTKALGTISEWVWYRRQTQDYFTAAYHHLTLNKDLGTNIQDSTTAYNTSNLPTAGLRQDVLNRIYSEMYREGGDTPSGIDENTNAPVFTLITSMETSDFIVRSDFQRREDIRYAYMGKGEMTPLMPGLPTKRRNFGGFVHEIDPYPRRFVFTGGAYVEVAPFTVSATTKGNEWPLNTAYLNAPYEESIVWHEGVYQEMVPKPIGPIGKFDFKPLNYQGAFTPRNILSDDCNPDGTMLYMRAVFSSAAKVRNRRLGWTIIHARCNQLSLRDCYAS